MKIKLPPEPKFDLDKLLDIAVPTDAVPPEAGAPATVPTAAVPTAAGGTGAVPTAKSNAAPTYAVPTAGVPTGKYDKLHNAFPESVKVPLRTGTIAMLKVKAQELGFGSMSKLIRSALKYALSHGDFKEGWDK